MTLGDKISYIAQEFLFPVINIFDKDIDRTKKMYLGPKGIKCIYNNRSLDKLVIWEQWVFKEYDEFLLPQDTTILEIGSHIGTSTIDFSKKYPQGKVYAVEAYPAHYELLKENIRINKLKNVVIGNFAVVGNKKEKIVKFSINPYNSAGHSIFGNTMTNQEVIEVEAVSLEDTIKRLKIKKVDVLHIDVEGAEFEILLNAPRKVFDNIKYISLEYHDILQDKYKHPILINLLEELGFEITIKKSIISRLLKLETGIINAVKKT